ncbi:NADH-quinone oxidoreductase subunit NuoE family protein [Spirochaeta dissipatitropha]
MSVQLETVDSTRVDLSPLNDFISGNAGTRGILIPVLQFAQEHYGYLPEAVLHHVSRSLQIPYSEVTGVVGFYSYFSTIPKGKNTIRVCLGTACYVRGGRAVEQAFEHELEISDGGTTEDRCFSLQTGRCFGACGLAPVVMVNDNTHQRVSSAGIKDICRQYRENKETDHE